VSLCRCRREGMLAFFLYMCCSGLWCNIVVE
jgi:hypothetical protein